MNIPLSGLRPAAQRLASSRVQVVPTAWGLPSKGDLVRDPNAQIAWKSPQNDRSRKSRFHAPNLICTGSGHDKAHGTRKNRVFTHNPQIPAIRQLLGERVKSTLCRPSRSAPSTETPETGLRRKEWKAPGHEAEHGSMTCALDIVLRVAGNENRYSFGPSELRHSIKFASPFSGRPQTRCFPRSRNRDC
jgi:hypothetical protein